MLVRGHDHAALMRAKSVLASYEELLKVVALLREFEAKNPPLNLIRQGCNRCYWNV